MRKFIKIVEGIEKEHGGDFKFDHTDLYLVHFQLSDLPKFVHWSLENKLANPHDTYRRFRQSMSLPYNPATDGLISGIDNLPLAKLMVQWAMREIMHEKSIYYEKMLKDIGVAIYTGPKEVKRVSHEEGAELSQYKYVRNLAEMPVTDDWEAVTFPNPAPSHGPGTFSRADAQLVVSRKFKVQRFPTSGEYHGVFGNSGW